MNGLKIPKGYKKATWRNATFAIAKKDLFDIFYNKVFTEGKKYSVVDRYQKETMLINDFGDRHGVTHGKRGWLKYFILLEKI